MSGRTTPVLARPVRTCVGCRERASQSELVRFVAVDGACAPDLHLRLPGRGAYVHPRPDCLDLAVRRRAAPRALRVTAPLDVTDLRVAVEARFDVHAMSEAPKAGRES